ncbi:MAG TPA: hypothetical protein GXZ32_02300 [Clostridiales bacterium]|nr:hypothetical protein [Clostridiales bacterium]
MEEKLHRTFVDSVVSILKKTAGLTVDKIGAPKEAGGQQTSQGIASVVSFSGNKIKGRCIIDMEQEVALDVVENIMGTRYDNLKELMVLYTISELNNIIAGDSITKLNNEFGTGLRLAPPVVFTGRKVVMYSSQVKEATVDIDTPKGSLRLIIAWEGSL